MAACSSGSTADLSSQRLVVGVAEVRVPVERDLGVEAEDRAVGRLGERVDLDQRGVLGDERLPQLHRDVDDLVGDLGRPAVAEEAALRDDLPGGCLVDALGGVDGNLGHLLRGLVRDLLDLHTAGDAGDAQERAVGPVEQVGEVVLLGDVGRRGDHDLVDRVALDVHAEDRGGVRLRLLGVVGELDPARLAPAARP